MSKVEEHEKQVSSGTITILYFSVEPWNSIYFSPKQMILMLLANTPYLSNMILCLFYAFSTKVCNTPVRALFHSPVLPSIFRSPLETYILLVWLSTFMHPWILSKFLSVSYLWSMSYLFRVCVLPKSHPSCKCMMRRSHTWVISFYSFMQNIPTFISLHQH